MDSPLASAVIVWTIMWVLVKWILIPIMGLYVFCWIRNIKDSLNNICTILSDIRNYLGRNNITKINDVRFKKGE